jgi:hypothetical protein
LPATRVVAHEGDVDGVQRGVAAGGARLHIVVRPFGAVGYGVRSLLGQSLAACADDPSRLRRRRPVPGSVERS